MPGIDAWLAEIGLERYASVFREAEIDVDILPELVEDDLRELKLPLGPRRKIWSAITRMAQTQQALPDGRAPVTSHPPGPQQDSPAERRHLTVMFVDLVGSTAMSSRFDAEDMRMLIAKFQSEIAGVVGAFGGFVAQFLGDGVLCYFGWPTANEDDTERAVRAGLRVIETVNRITAPDGEALAVRVGVATGVVIVGDLMMNGNAQEAAAVGETTNLAARLQGIAGKNRLVVSDDALSLLGSTFECETLGKQDLKGIGHTVEAFVVTGETVQESRFAARGHDALTPIMGRDNEINTVMERWSLARSGQGQMVLVNGEAGIGKSRLLQSISDTVATETHSRVTYQCSPYHTESAFYPLINQITFKAGFTADDTNEQRLSKMEASVSGDATTHSLMALLLGLDGAERYGKPDLTPAQQRSQLMQVLLEHLLEKSRSAPLLVVFEDVHWIDPTSLEWLELILSYLPDQNILILATTRPSFDHVFAAQDIITQLPLKRLNKDTTRAIVSKMAGNLVLPDEMMSIIARRTDGVPLFVEELTKLILESGALRPDGKTHLTAGSLSDAAIPATLHDSLMARLDRLGPTKEIAQIAACVGREFSHDLIEQICDLSAAELEEALNHLIANETIQKGGTLTQITYSFKHALIRDAAYDGLLKERRMTYHRRILSALELEVDAEPELLATHAEAAGLKDRAIELWQAAGKAAIARPAYKEAEAHVRRAIGLNDPQVSSGKVEALSKAVELKVQLFVALSPGIGLWADETHATLEEALALADRVDDSPLRGDIIYGLLLSSYFRGSLESSRERADELTTLAAASGDVAQLLVAKRLTGNVQLSLGNFPQAAAHFNEAADLCERAANQDLAARFGHDPEVAVKIYQALAATFEGKTTEATQFRDAAINRAERIGHTNTTCAMLGFALTCAHVADDRDAEKRYLKNLQHLIEEHSVTASSLWAEVAAITLRLAEGDETAVNDYYAVEQKVLDANIRLLLPGNRVLAARRMLALGLEDEAREIARGVEPMMDQTGEKSWLPEYRRLQASFALLENNVGEAEAHLKQAMALATKSGSMLWEIRAATDLAALRHKAGRTGEALSTIKPVAARMGPGDCPREIEAATALIAEMQAA